MLRPTTLLVLGTTVAAQAAPAAADRVSTAMEQAARCATAVVDAGATVGMVVGMRCGERVEIRGYGHTAPDSQVTPNADTVYEIGSISKVFTGILLADAVVRGVVALDTPVRDLVPQGTRVPERDGAKIQLQHLTSHTSGLPRLPANFAPADWGNPYHDYGPARLWAGLTASELASVPGRSYAYSNFAVGLLGQLLVDKEHAANYETLLQVRITKPLLLPHTTTRLDAEVRERLAPGCNDCGQRVASWTFDALTGCGGIRSTARDLMAFAGAALAANAADERKTPLRRAFQLAAKPCYRPPFLQKARAPAVGCGWHLGPARGVLWHNGATGGYCSMLLLDTESGFAVVVLSNTTATGLVDAVARQALAAWQGHAVRLPKVRKAVRVDAATLRSYAGRYRLAPGKEFSIEVRDGVLTAQLTGQPRLPVAAASATRFFYRAVAAELEFTVEQQKVTALTLFQNGRTMKAPRIDR
ncbi:MAG: serine hydrolase [Planctomycetes bacterium]|nr:serine hydrolase [Planctomycetota bacterium]MCB9870737.1 serine hydrolase [Planctomycetota bacterium]MCB9889072.1 serine hydrolase [Planctomycetota bacterium]